MLQISLYRGGGHISFTGRGGRLSFTGRGGRLSFHQIIHISTFTSPVEESIEITVNNIWRIFSCIFPRIQSGTVCAQVPKILRVDGPSRGLHCSGKVSVFFSVGYCVRLGLFKFFLSF